MTNKHPRLRSHTRRRKSGKVVTYYFYDRRPEGEPDIPLGTDYEEALRLPSEHDYGNGVAIFTRDGDTARDFTNRVNVGMVGVNFAIPVPLSYYTFGGWKRSGFGDLNQHGPDSVRFYTKTKTVTSRWPSGVKEGAEFVIPTMR